MNTILLIASSFFAYALFIEIKRRVTLRKIARMQARIDRIKALMAPIYPMTTEEIEEYAKECEAKEQARLQAAERSAQRAYRLRYVQYLLCPFQYVWLKLRGKCLDLKFELDNILFEKGLLRGERPVAYEIVEGRIVEKRSSIFHHTKTCNDAHSFHLPDDRHDNIGAQMDVSHDIGKLDVVTGVAFKGSDVVDQ